VPYVRTVKTASGATAVQIVYSFHRGSRQIEHVGSAHSEAELELLKAAARQKLAAGQGVLDLGLDTAAPGGPLPITASRMGCLLDALAHAYDVLGFGQAAGGDEVNQKERGQPVGIDADVRPVGNVAERQVADARNVLVHPQPASGSHVFELVSAEDSTHAISGLVEVAGFEQQMPG